jgi:hypothetical protein
MIAVGSPIGLFLLLKGEKLILSDQVEDSEEAVIQPCVEKLFNIFHPNDPVAYRIEPLLDKRYKAHKPVPIPYTKGGLTGTIAGISDMSNNLVEKTQHIMSGFVNTTSNIVSGVGRASMSWFKSPPRPPASSDTVSTTVNELHQIELKEVQEKKSKEDSSAHSTRFQASDFNPSLRVDYVLQESIMENPYLSALGVHMNYWSDQDCAAFLVRALHDLIHSSPRRNSIDNKSAEK